MSAQVFEGDCLEVMANMPDNHFDAIVTDPPYHFTSIVKRFGKEGAAPAKGDIYARASRGFMGKEWDGGDIAFRPETWAEALRIMKPGAHLVAFGAPKNYHRLACAIEDAGFEIRDSLMWVFGTGFPKSLNVGEGRGTALKPAYEPIVLARKPLSEKTVATNVLRWGTGALNIDATRIGMMTHAEIARSGTSTKADGWGMKPKSWKDEGREPQGRWPANLCHDGSQQVLDLFPQSKDGVAGKRGGNGGDVMRTGFRSYDDTWGGYGGEGSAARFFYSAKASKTDRAGSKHPTVKPVSLMQWLVRMVTPPNGIVLDPFAGSGTTGKAAQNEGFGCILIEREEEYRRDIERRLFSLVAAE